MPLSRRENDQGERKFFDQYKFYAAFEMLGKVYRLRTSPTKTMVTYGNLVQTFSPRSDLLKAALSHDSRRALKLELGELFLLQKGHAQTCIIYVYVYIYIHVHLLQYFLKKLQLPEFN